MQKGTSLSLVLSESLTTMAFAVYTMADGGFNPKYTQVDGCVQSDIDVLEVRHQYSYRVSKGVNLRW